MSQIHTKFKAFVSKGTSSEQSRIAASEFTIQNKVSAKSLGVEYLESRDLLVLTLGYEEGGADFAPSLVKEVSLGKLDPTPETIESALSTAAAQENGVICHEFYVTGDGEFRVLFLTQK